MVTINMRSAALAVKGQGVGSCYREQLRLVTEGLSRKYEVRVNSPRRSDITHYHTVNPNYFIERQFNRRYSAGVCYVHFLPDTVDESLRLPWLYRAVFYRYLLAFYNSMDYLVVVNPYFTEKLRALGIDRPKIEYIPNYVSDTDFHPLLAQDRMAARRSLDIPPNRFTVLGAGQLQTRKGIFDFAETARRLPDIQFIWAGGFSFGKMSDGYEALQTLTRNPPPNLRFTGIVDRVRMNELYGAADLFFLPSFNELFPMTILEAAASATPVLLRDIPLYKGILNGFYAAAKDVDGFVTQIDRLRTDTDALDRLTRQAVACHGMYSEPAVLARWEQLYDKACRCLPEKKGIPGFGWTR